MMWPYRFNSWETGFFPVFISLLFIVLAVIILSKIFGSHGENPTDKQVVEQKADDKTPLYYLKERYAKGEIDKKQFEEIKRDIV